MFNKTLLSLLFVSVLGACSSDSEDDSNSPTINSAADIAGVWDASIDDPYWGKDELYVVITNDGQIINYDFLGDEYDNYMACYDKSYGLFGGDGSGEFVGDNEFKVTTSFGMDELGDEDLFSDGFSELNTYFKAELSGEQLSFSFLRMEMLGQVNNPDSTDSVEFSYVIDLSVKDQMSFTFSTTMRSNGQELSETSSATYERDVNGEWRTIEQDFNHLDFSFDDLAEGFYLDGTFDGLSDVTTLTKHSGSESDFTPLCSESSVKANNRFINKQLLRLATPVIKSAVY